MKTIDTKNRYSTRRQLLTTVSAFALIASACGASDAQAAGADRPLLWIELGGQMENVSGQGDVFAPPFLAANPTSDVVWNGISPLEAQKPPKFAFDEDGKITFQPDGSDWSFSAAVRFGRSGNFRHVRHQTYNLFVVQYKYGVPRYTTPSKMRAIDKFADTHARRSETHAIVDFQAGKDVGLGMFGSNASSTLNLGVRFAQFISKQVFDIRARPELHFKYATFPAFHLTLHMPYFHTYHATGRASRNFHGVGPLISWTGSAPFAGNLQDGELTFDWGASAALLFGRQRAHVQHVESAHYITPIAIVAGGSYQSAYQPRQGGHDKVRDVTIPNVGGSIGASWRVQDFKVSMGYRADFFFGAMDTGIDAMKKSNLAFNGPYASISVGLGD